MRFFKLVSNVEAIVFSLAFTASSFHLPTVLNFVSLPGDYYLSQVWRFNAVYVSVGIPATVALFRFERLLGHV